MLDSQTSRCCGQESRIDSLLASLAPLLQSAPDKVSLALPHTAKYSTSCTTTGQTHGPNSLQRKLLETIVTLCSLHTACNSAAAALEVAADRVTMYIAADDSPTQQLRHDVENWVASIRDVAEDSDILSSSVNIEEHSETLLMAGVYRACYQKIRARMREDGLLVETIRKLSENVPDKRPLQGGHQVDVEEDPNTPLGQLCMNLELLMSCTEPETAEESDEIRLAAACIAGWAADQALREDWQLCRTVDGIDTGAIQTIRDVCVLSTLVDTLVTIAKCAGLSLALPLEWAVEWVNPPACPPCPMPHPESTLIRHIVDNALAVHPYIATSALPCYPCVMLVRAVNLTQSIGTDSGTGRDFMLRGCDAHVVLPWSSPWGHCSSEPETQIVLDVMRELEQGLERDLDRLQKRRRAGTFTGDVSSVVRGLQEKPVQVKVKWADYPPIPWRTGCVSMRRVPTP